MNGELKTGSTDETKKPKSSLVCQPCDTEEKSAGTRHPGYIHEISPRIQLEYDVALESDENGIRY